ncbi:MAG: FtsX-like permease family protein, partial [Lachnospiraceae bacterium]|nr:FtsX-like permease family protein [Lachnospiraceae bacterium]
VPKPDTYTFDNNTYMRNMLLPEGSSQRKAVELINYYANINGLSANKNSIESALKAERDRSRPFIVITLVFSGILLFLSSIGCMGVMLVNISFRKKDFSLLMSMGLRKKTLSLLLLMEGMTVSMAGYLAGVLLFNLITLVWVDNPFFRASPTAYLITFLITTAAGLLGEAIPVKAISALDPISVIKEKN